MFVAAYSSHSMRTGYATTAGEHDEPGYRIQQRMRHKSMDTTGGTVQASVPPMMAVEAERPAPQLWRKLHGPALNAAARRTRGCGDVSAGAMADFALTSIEKALPGDLG